MIAGLTEILEDAKRNRRAAGAFNTVSLESIDAVISAAEQKNVPVIIQHAQLHELEGRDIGDELRPDILPARASLRDRKSVV